MESHLRRYLRSYLLAAIGVMFIALGTGIIYTANNAKQTETIIHGKVEVDFTNGNFTCRGAPKEVCDQIEKSFDINKLLLKSRIVDETKSIELFQEAHELFQEAETKKAQELKTKKAHDIKASLEADKRLADAVADTAKALTKAAVSQAKYKRDLENTIKRQKLQATIDKASYYRDMSEANFQKLIQGLKNEINK